MNVPSTMKAVVFYQHGGPEVLQYAEVPTPQPGPGEALVEVHACALNHLDLFVREGWPGLKLKLPHILGSDVSGVVAELGPDTEGPAPGTHVVIDPGIVLGEDEWTRRGESCVSPFYKKLGEELPGGYAQYVCVPTRNLVPMLDEAGFEESAAACLVFLTAWRMLITRGGLRAGETVLILGAGGGVNSAAIQVAKLAGAQVYATTSTDEKMAKARELGADEVVNYRADPDWSRTIFLLTGRRGVDIVVDNVGAATWPKSIRTVSRGGRIITVGATTGPMGETDIRYLFNKQISIIGSTMGTHQDFLEVMKLVWQGRLRSIVDQVMPLAEARQAQELLAHGEQFGKVVLVP